MLLKRSGKLELRSDAFERASGVEETGHFVTRKHAIAACCAGLSKKDRPHSRGRSSRSPLILPVMSRLSDRFVRESDLGNNAPQLLNVVEATQNRKLHIPRCQTDALTRQFANVQACLFSS